MTRMESGPETRRGRPVRGCPHVSQGQSQGDPVEAIGSEGCLHSQLLRRGTSHLEDDGLKFSHSQGDGKLQREALTGGLFVSALKVSISQKSLPGRGQGCP